MRTKTEKLRSELSLRTVQQQQCAYTVGHERATMPPPPPPVNRYQFADVFGALQKYMRDRSVN
jgi:hypothetical protein